MRHSFAALSVAEWRLNLRHSLISFSTRGLAVSARFCADLLSSLPSLDATSHSASPAARPGQPWYQVIQPGDTDAFLCAKAYFDRGEYLSAAHTLSFLDAALPLPMAPTSSTSTVPKMEISFPCVFLRLFARFLHAEGIREQDVLAVSDAPAHSAVASASVPLILDELRCWTALAESYSNSNSNSNSDSDFDSDDCGCRYDPFLEYLRGACLLSMARWEEAFESFAKAVVQVPLLWSAWTGLAQSVMDNPLFASAAHEDQRVASTRFRTLYPHLFSTTSGANSNSNSNSSNGSSSNSNGNSRAERGRRLLWSVWSMFDVYCQHESQARPDRMQDAAQYLKTHVIPPGMHDGCPLLLTLDAYAYYAVRRFEEARELLERARQIAPFRLDSLDTLSNILYVQNDRTALAELAQAVSAVDRFHTISALVVGNYYSLRGRHELAAQYFKRAVQMDGRCVAAWTLLGHECVELKNTSAAVVAYRRAIDVVPADFRAWYGLGQTYELLQRWELATWYYSSAAQLRPYDGRIWAALGFALSKLENWVDAARCFHRAAKPRAAMPLFLVGGPAVNHKPSVDGVLSAAGSGGEKSVVVMTGQIEVSALVRLGAVYERLGKRELAAGTYWEWLARCHAIATETSHDQQPHSQRPPPLRPEDRGVSEDEWTADAWAAKRARSIPDVETLSSVCEGQDIASAFRFLASFYATPAVSGSSPSTVDLRLEELGWAEECALRLSDCGGSFVADARILLAEIRNQKRTALASRPDTTKNASVSTSTSKSNSSSSSQSPAGNVSSFLAGRMQHPDDDDDDDDAMVQDDESDSDDDQSNVLDDDEDAMDVDSDDEEE
eukprot:ANDGO_01825.mRNA.1 Anaphase-promoting complex subunit 8